MRAWQWLVSVLASRMLFRRLILVSSLVWLGVIGERVTRPEVLLLIQEPGAKVVMYIFATLGLIIGLYQYMRSRDNNEPLPQPPRSSSGSNADPHCDDERRDMVAEHQDRTGG